MASIIGYGVYIPKYRIKLEDIANVWQKDPKEIISGLRVLEKSVSGIDEDAVTMGVEAGCKALEMAKVDPKKIESAYMGSESFPYAVNPASTIVAEYLGFSNEYYASDLQFACKAATAGIQVTLGLIESKKIKYGLVVGSDSAQGKPHDALEYTASSAAVAFVLGNKNIDSIADILYTSSYSSDTPDFWRREGQKYPTHAGRFSGEPAYFTHILGESAKLLHQSKLKPKNFDYCVFHMPNGKFPRAAAKKLGFSDEQLNPSLTVEKVGNPYSASLMLGLSSILDIAKPNQKIFAVSYGSGAGSDGFILKTTPALLKKRNVTPFLKKVENKKYIGYVEYLRKTQAIG